MKINEYTGTVHLQHYIHHNKICALETILRALHQRAELVRIDQSDK